MKHTHTDTAEITLCDNYLEIQIQLQNMHSLDEL